MKIVIPMAGEGTRVEGTTPKPFKLIGSNFKTMIQSAVESLDIIGCEYCFVTRHYDDEWNYELNKLLRRIVYKPTIVEIDYLTNGPAISVLQAPHSFFKEDSLLIANCDQILYWNSTKFLKFLDVTDADAVVVTYPANTTKNSYAQIVYDGGFPYVQFGDVREKEVISEHSLNGIHWVKRGHLFSDAVERMINNKDAVNSEFYIGPAFSYIHGVKRIYPITKEEHWAVGTNEDIETYLKAFPNGYQKA